MDRVSAVQRALVAKMATEQLIKKLGEEGVPKEEVDAMNREQRMEAWAGMIADGKDVLKASAAEASSSAMDLEREKMVFAERREERQAATAAVAARRDAADREERREERREAAAAAARREADDREERREAAAAAARQAAAEADERRAAAAEQLAAQREANSIARKNGERFADRDGRRAAQLKRSATRSAPR